MPNRRISRITVNETPAPTKRLLIDSERRRYAAALEACRWAESTGHSAVGSLFALIGRLRESIAKLDLDPGEQLELHSVLDDLLMKAVMKMIDSSAREAAGLARRDAVTELPNRAAFEQRLIEELERARLINCHLSVMLFDVDHFKGINDRFGHPSGDRVLREIAVVLHSSLRHSDMVFRYGGDEFAAICPATSDHATRIILPRIERRLKSHFHNSAFPGPIGLSAGAATCPGDGTEAASLVRVADQRLYECKRERQYSAIARS